jgi:OmcA/MtrC family decaheme c-type cytochrome
MKERLFQRTLSVLLLCCAVIFTAGLLGGCKGDTGPQGATGPAGADATVGTVAAGTLTFDDLRNVVLGGKILSVSTAGDQPVVTFQVYNKGTMEGIAGLRSFSLHMAQLQPEANGSNSYWLHYITSASSASGSFRPTTDPVSQFNTSTGAMTKQGYSVVDNGDGIYVVTFASNIKSGATATWGTTYYKPASATYDPNLTHRVVVGVRSVAVPGVVGLTPGAYAGPINPITGANFAQFTNTNGVNLAFDFVPATGAVISPSARDIVTIDRCNQCHYKIQYGSNNTSGHFGSRTDTKTCVMCHTPQNVVSGQTATTNVDFTPFIHKIHMGERLPVIETGLTGTFNEVTFPQDIRNCTMCHQGALADNWKTKPTRKACGSCHNNVNFATGANHPAPAGSEIQTDDHLCAGCHSVAGIAANHVPVALPDPGDPRLGGTNTHTNAEYIAATGVVPAGAHKINWLISSVTVSGGKPSIKFKFQSDGANMVFTAATSTASELMAGFAGSPSAYFVWAEPQDGITKPADFNKSASAYIRNVWNGTVSSATATITGPDGSGFYTLTRTGTTIPATAVMVTGGIGYSYGSGTPPLVQTDLAAYPYNATTGAGGLAVPAPNVWKVATNYTARRAVVDTNKCNICHAGLGVEPTFHVGQRNDAPTCSFCHNPGRASQGWTVNASTFVHAIHAAAKRTVDFTWDATSTTGDEADEGFFLITYPGILKNCEQCHVAGGYDFSGSMYTANNGAQGVTNMLLSTTITGSLSSTSTTSYDYSPYVTLDFDYGAAGAGTNLVNSPIAAACFACHDTTLATSHMVQNGGTIYDTRANALTRTETCLICHGPAANTAYGDYVPAIKAVHRWW